LRRTMGDKATADAVRLYMVPGMQHCSGGPGATVFGQSGDGVRGDAEHDALTALEQWVEAGKSPGTLTAVHRPDAREAKGHEFTRPLCVYPQTVKYVKGDTNEAGSFACSAP